MSCDPDLKVKVRDLEVKVVTFDPRSRSCAAILDVKNIFYMLVINIQTV